VIDLPDLNLLDGAAKDALILAQAQMIASLTKRIAELEAKLGLPARRPDNSSLPPSKGWKASGEASSKPKGKAHKGSHRMLHPHPTRTIEVRAQHCAHCGADVSGANQSALERYSPDSVRLRGKGA
jgi:transposase